MSKLLIDEPPLQILPSLAVAIGLNEAVLLQQIHYWLLMRKHEYDGYYWVYNSVPKWAKQFPFWSESTLKRTLTSLRNKNLVITGNFNKLAMDKTLWYRINYDAMEALDAMEEDVTPRSGQNDPMEEVKMTRPLPETTTETTTETQTYLPNGKVEDPWDAIDERLAGLRPDVPSTQLDDKPEPVYVDDPFDDGTENKHPKWKVPKNPFQVQALDACGRKYFASRAQRAKWNKIEKSMVEFKKLPDAKMHIEWALEKIKFVREDNLQYRKQKLTHAQKWDFDKLLSMINNEENRQTWVSRRRLNR